MDPLVTLSPAGSNVDPFWEPWPATSADDSRSDKGRDTLSNLGVLIEIVEKGK